MSEKGIKIFNLPNNGEVYNANWRDDIAEEVEEEKKQIDFEAYENEAGYDSSKVKESAEADRKIELFSKTRLRGIGSKTLRLVEAA